MGALQAHSSLRLLQKPVPRHPQVGKCEQCVQLRLVLDQPAVAHLHVSELALDHPERMFNLGPDARLDLLQWSKIAPIGVLLSTTLRLPGRMATCQSASMSWVSSRLHTP